MNNMISTVLFLCCIAQVHGVAVHEAEGLRAQTPKGGLGPTDTMQPAAGHPTTFHPVERVLQSPSKQKHTAKVVSPALDAATLKTLKANMASVKKTPAVPVDESKFLPQGALETVLEDLMSKKLIGADKGVTGFVAKKHGSSKHSELVFRVDATQHKGKAALALEKTLETALTSHKVAYGQAELFYHHGKMEPRFIKTQHKLDASSTQPPLQGGLAIQTEGGDGRVGTLGGILLKGGFPLSVSNAHIMHTRHSPVCQTAPSWAGDKCHSVGFVESYDESLDVGLSVASAPYIACKQNLMHVHMSSEPISSTRFLGLDWAPHSLSGLQKTGVRTHLTKGGRVAGVTSDGMWLVDTAEYPSFSDDPARTLCIPDEPDFLPHCFNPSSELFHSTLLDFSDPFVPAGFVQMTASALGGEAYTKEDVHTVLIMLHSMNQITLFSARMDSGSWVVSSDGKLAGMLRAGQWTRRSCSFFSLGLSKITVKGIDWCGLVDQTEVIPADALLKHVSKTDIGGLSGPATICTDAASVAEVTVEVTIDSKGSRAPSGPDAAKGPIPKLQVTSPSSTHMVKIPRDATVQQAIAKASTVARHPISSLYIAAGGTERTLIAAEPLLTQIPWGATAPHYTVHAK